MVLVYTTHNNPWPCQQCVSVLLYIMRCRTGNVCCIVVINVPVYLYLVKRQIYIQHFFFKQSAFMSKETYNIVYLTEDLHNKNVQRV